MPILYETPASSPLKFKIETTNGPERIAFKPKEWNNIIRFGLFSTGEFFIQYYLPLRFEAYARAVGIYAGKKSGGLPLVHTGNLRAMVLGSSRVTATATANTQRAVIVIPVPNIAGASPTKGHQYVSYAVNPIVIDTLSRITERELERLSQVCAAVITMQIEGADVKVNRLGKTNATISPQQRASISSFFHSRPNLRTMLSPQHRRVA